MEKHLQQAQSNVIKIVLFGPESTGKTTLAKALAEHFDTIWVEEYARTYLQNKWDTEQKACEIKDLKPIAIGQIELENKAVQKANELIFLDTNLTVTETYSDIYYGYTEQWLQELVDNLTYDLYFLTQVDVPWEADDLRDSPDNRDTTFEIFKQKLVDKNKAFVVLSGSFDERMSMAISWINDLKIAKSIGLNASQLIELKERNISVLDIKKHHEYISYGMNYTEVVCPATVNHGIHQLDDSAAEFYANYFESNKNNQKIVKFVPASGAASRMFQFLSVFLNDFKKGNETINAYLNRSQNQPLATFLYNREKFAFHNNLINELKLIYPNYEELDDDTKAFYYIDTLLNKKPFEYLKKPKAVLLFHKSENTISTPIEAHFLEGVHYAHNKDRFYIHFTITEEHLPLFEQEISSIKNEIIKTHQMDVNVSYSFQEKSTDTIAFDENKKPLLKEGKYLIFRPSGHGALIKNLNKIDADIVFIKNIDNVSPKNRELDYMYKKALGGQLIFWQQQIFKYLNELKNSVAVSNDLIEEVSIFLKEKLFVPLAADFFKYTKQFKTEHLIEKLNRPIRVCGMVKNEGEPGGGPFWTQNKKGTLSLQILEKTQIDINKPQQKKLVDSSTHFNPVDIVCSVKDYNGMPFDLEKFVDANAGLVVEKNKDGQYLIAYELPGLWNGSMSNWNTIFVEIPLSIFNPVKTVNDLLKPAHQP